MKLTFVSLAACALSINVAHAQSSDHKNVAKPNAAKPKTAMSEVATSKTATSKTATSSTRSSVWTALPPALPAWLESKRNHEVFYRRGAYNFAIYEIPALARDMNGVAVGHAMAYEALVTNREKTLETTVWQNIDRVLKNPPKLMPAERFLSPTFGRKYGVLELVFDWTHVSHAQTIDNFVSTKADNAQKDRETEALWHYYKSEGAPFLITGLPMNMAWLDSQPYSGAFRKKYPKVNALFWGYHWLQTSVYDGLRGKSRIEQQKTYAMLGARYHDVELYDVKRPFMPMMAETSPLFSAQYPEIANTFDNLHMLHDMVNDILATDEIGDGDKKTQIKRAVFIVSPDAHKSCKPGENRGVIDGVSHDHRFMQGMRGMGMMKNGLEKTADANAVSPANHGEMTTNDAEMRDAEMRDAEMNSATSSTRSSDSQTETRAFAHVAESSKDELSKNEPSKNEPSKSEPSKSEPLENEALEKEVLESEPSKNDATKSSDDESGDEKAPVFDATELMWMPKMGWMNMSQCHHCSMLLPGSGEEKSAAWQASTVSAEGWTMRVRCALCARDMSGETKGGAILSLSTEDPNVRVTVFSDDEGNLTTESKGAVFLEEKAGHARCSQWSQAFTSQAAFEAYVKKNPKYADAKMLTFAEWANVEAAETPETYFKEDGPVENPYAEDLRARGIETEMSHGEAKADEAGDQ